MEQPDLLVDGRRVSLMMPWGDLELVTCWPGGTETITFNVSRGHALFRPGALVTLDYGGIRIAAGRLNRPTRGELLQAVGLWRLGEEFTALDGSLAPATSVHAAVDGPIGRGMPWRRGPDGAGSIYDLSPEPLVRGMPNLDPDRTHSVSEFMDASAKERGHLWGVDPYRFAFMQGWAAPTMHLLPDVDGLGRNADGYASCLIARYNSVTTGLYEPAIYEDAEATKRWGYRERTLTTLLAEGQPITEEAALGILAGILSQGRASMGWERPVEVQYGDVVNVRQQPIDLWDLGQPAQTMTGHGLLDDTADLDGGTTALIRVARTRHRGATVLIEPAGLSTPMEDALAAAGVA